MCCNVDLQDSITFVRESVKEVITSMDSNLTCSLLKLLDCFFEPFIPREVRELFSIIVVRLVNLFMVKLIFVCVCGQGKKPLSQEKLSRLQELIEPWFIFALVWSVGATGDADSCQRFSAWLRGKMTVEKVNSSINVS